MNGTAREYKSDLSRARGESIFLSVFSESRFSPRQCAGRGRTRAPGVDFLPCIVLHEPLRW